MTDLDDLMSRDPLSLSSQDIDEIITYHRRQRARRAAGEKLDKPKIDLSSVAARLNMRAPEKVEPKLTRRL